MPRKTPENLLNETAAKGAELAEYVTEITQPSEPLSMEKPHRLLKAIGTIKEENYKNTALHGVAAYIEGLQQVTESMGTKPA